MPMWNNAVVSKGLHGHVMHFRVFDMTSKEERTGFCKSDRGRLPIHRWHISTQTFPPTPTLRFKYCMRSCRDSQSQVITWRRFILIVVSVKLVLVCNDGRMTSVS